MQESGKIIFRSKKAHEFRNKFKCLIKTNVSFLRKISKSDFGYNLFVMQLFKRITHLYFILFYYSKYIIYLTNFYILSIIKFSLCFISSIDKKFPKYT